MTRSHPKVNYTKTITKSMSAVILKNKINLSSTIFENTKQFTMDDPLDAAGFPVTYTKIPRPGMGTPVYDDATLFEFLILETFQAGLSWITI
jgi:hypothetical protein